MPYKSTNKIKIVFSQALIPFILITGMLAFNAQAQSECSRRPFPSNISLKADQSIIINLDEYFDGSNLSYKVSPNNTYSTIQATYECSSVTNQSVGKMVSSRYLLYEGQEIIAVLAQSPFVEGAFSFYIYQIQKFKLTTLNLPREKISECTHFDVQIINSTHFSPTIDCKSNNKSYLRVLLTTVGEFGSPYGDWIQVDARMFVRTTAAVKVQLNNDVLIRGVFSTTSSYIQVWLWNQQERAIIEIFDKIALGTQNFNIKSMKLYGSLLIVLDYQSGLYLFRITSQKRLSFIGKIYNPFYEQFQYNPLTGVLYLAKKGKIVSSMLNPYTLSLVMTGQSYNIYKYESIGKMLISDSIVVALGDTALNIFRKGAAVAADTRHYSLYLVTNPQTIYSRLNNNGLNILLLQNPGLNLQLSSCKIRLPFLRLTTPKISILTTVTATSLVQKQQSICTQSFMFQADENKFDEIYDNGYRVDNQVVYANQGAQGVIDLSKYGVGRGLMYSIKTINDSILQNETRVKKSLPMNYSFIGKPILAGGSIGFASSWQNIMMIQLSRDNSFRHYLCNQKLCNFSTEQFRLQPIDLISHETIQKSKEQQQILQAVLQQSIMEDKTVHTVLARSLTISNSELNIGSLCNISFTTVNNDYWNITQLQIYNSLLFIVMPYRKQIRIYDLRQNQCPNVLNLNLKTCPWGYFAPSSIHFNKAKSTLSQIFILKQWNQILTVRLQKQIELKPVLVNRNTIDLVVNYTLLFTYPYLLAFDLLTNKAYTYYFDDQYIIQYLREIPLNGLRLKSSPEQRNDFARMLEPRYLSLTLYDETNRGKVPTIFKIDQLISGAIQYLAYTSKYQEVFSWLAMGDTWYALRMTLLNSSATLAQINCKANATYLNPTLQLFFGRTPFSYEQYSQNVTLVLSTASKSTQHQFKISVSNVGDTIKRGTSFPFRGDSIQPKQTITIDDKRWFLGSVFYYEFDCPDCGTRIFFKQKASVEDRQPLIVPSNRFWLQDQANIVKVIMGNSLVELQYNHTLWPIGKDDEMYDLKKTTLLTSKGANCLYATPSNRQNEIISLCQLLNEDDNTKVYYLSLISTASYKSFVVAQTQIIFDNNADIEPKLILKNDIIIVYTPEIAYLKALWEVQQRIQFINLDIIDQQDIQSSICSIDIASNTTLQSTPITNILFSLIVTQCSSNIYFTSFLIYLEKEEYVDEDGNTKVNLIPNLHVNSAQNINLIAKFAENQIQIPTEAKIIQTIATKPNNEDDLSIITVFDKFHTYEFILYLSKLGVAFNLTINKVFYKYGNYEAVSAQRQTYLAIKYKSKLLGREERYGFFDIDGKSDGTRSIKEYYMFSGYSLQNGATGSQQIPWVFQNQTLIHFNADFLQVLNITHLLRAQIKGYSPDGQSLGQTLYTQKIQIAANNIASARSAIIVLKAVDRITFTAGQIVLMVFGSIAFLIGSIFGIRFAVKKYKMHSRLVPLLQDSQLEEADLEHEEQLRMSGRINMSMRESAQQNE